MAKTKTQAIEASVEAYLDAIKDEARRKDCDFLVKLMTRITRHLPKMWGPSIVGFDSYHYKYESGHEGDAGVTGFSSRKPDLSVYLVASGPRQDELLSKLGKHKMGKTCLYIRKFSDIDTKVLEQLVSDSVAEVKRRCGWTDCNARLYLSWRLQPQSPRQILGASQVAHPCQYPIHSGNLFNADQLQPGAGLRARHHRPHLGRAVTDERHYPRRTRRLPAATGSSLRGHSRGVQALGAAFMGRRAK